MKPSESAWTDYLTAYNASLVASDARDTARAVYEARLTAGVTDPADIPYAWSDYLSAHDASLVAIATHKVAVNLYDALPNHLRKRAAYEAMSPTSTDSLE